MKKYHDVKNLRFEDDFLIITINGEDQRFPLKDVSAVLEKASKEERNTYEISPAGYGIHWPLLDEDISIDGLLGVVHAPARKKKIA
ncbi:MAG: DUF2442 domain-containing protein [Candidatus Hodarchaeota archaeon]